MAEILSYSECAFLINSNFYPLINLLSDFSHFEYGFFLSLYTNQRSGDYFYIENFSDLSYSINSLEKCKNKVEVIYKNKSDEIIIHKTQEVDLKKECFNEMNIKYSVNENNLKEKKKLYYEIQILLKNTEDKIYVLFTFSYISSNEFQIKSPFNSKMKKSLNDFLCTCSKDLKFKGNTKIYISIVIPASKKRVFKEITNLENCKYSSVDQIDIKMSDGSKIVTKKDSYLSISWKDIKSEFYIEDFRYSDDRDEDCFYIKSLFYSSIKRSKFNTLFLIKEISSDMSIFIVSYDYKELMSKQQLDQQLIKMYHFNNAIKELATMLYDVK